MLPYSPIFNQAGRGKAKVKKDTDDRSFKKKLDVYIFKISRIKPDKISLIHI